MRLSVIFMLITSALALPTSQPQAAHDSGSIAVRGVSDSQQGSGQAAAGSSVSYKKYCGKVGSYPKESEWQTFDKLWQINLPVIKSHITNQSWITSLKEKIRASAKKNGVDERLILAVVMQESGGKLDVACTGDNGVNCGIMQAAKGSLKFDGSNPVSSIAAMIKDGVEGTGRWPTGGVGLAWIIKQGSSDSSLGMSGQNVFEALRVYNTGKVSDPSNLDHASSGTPSYVNDIANRLRGWDGSGTGQVNANLAC